MTLPSASALPTLRSGADVIFAYIILRTSGNEIAIEFSFPPRTVQPELGFPQ